MKKFVVWCKRTGYFLADVGYSIVIGMVMLLIFLVYGCVGMVRGWWRED